MLSRNKVEYVLTFVDDFSRYVWLYFLSHKSQVFHTFKRWLAQVERESGARLRTLRSDNGGEYTSNEFKAFMDELGIHHETTIAGTPEQNGVAERMNRTLMDKARANMAQAQADGSWWAEALYYTAHVRNRVSSQALPNHMSPFERWTGKVPTLAMAKVWGCMAQVKVPSEQCSKLQAKAVWGMFLSIPENTKGWKLWLPEHKAVVVSRNVIFHEDMTMVEWKARSKATLVSSPLPGFPDELLEGNEPPSNEGSPAQDNEPHAIECTQGTTMIPSMSQESVSPSMVFLSCQ
jgi:hypothetical protein